MNKKTSHNSLGRQRHIAWKKRRQKQQQRDKHLNYEKALSYQEVVVCRCYRCGAQTSVRIEKRTLSLVGESTIGWCQQCNGWRLLNFFPDGVQVMKGELRPQREQLVQREKQTQVEQQKQRSKRSDEKALISACKSTGLRYRFEGQYVVLTGRTVRWYLDFISLHKSSFFCGKHRRIWGKNTDYEPFYKLRKVGSIDAILEIGEYDTVLEGRKPVPMSMELRDALRRRRIEKSCAVHDFTLEWREPFACIKTDLSEWRFDYHKDRITLLHKNNGPVLDEISGAVMDYHVQYANRELAVEQVVLGIATHDEWRALYSPSTRSPQIPIE